jgi:hypothetical protein
LISEEATATVCQNPCGFDSETFVDFLRASSWGMRVRGTLPLPLPSREGKQMENSYQGRIAKKLVGIQIREEEPGKTSFSQLLKIILDKWISSF